MFCAVSERERSEMDALNGASPQRKRGNGKVVTRIALIASFGMLAVFIMAVVYQIIDPPPARHMLLVRDIPLPSALPVEFVPHNGVVAQTDSLTPGVSVRFDHFDFQALDTTTNLLF